jgi:RNA polymerase sigma-70 factor, ECF subfamily
VDEIATTAMHHSSENLVQQTLDGFCKALEPNRGEAAPALLTSTSPKTMHLDELSIQTDRSMFSPVHHPRLTSVTFRRRNSHTILKHYDSAPPNTENPVAGSVPVLHFLTLPSPRGKALQFQSFDESYLSRLRGGDFRTQENFSAYFSALIKIKLGSRLKSREAIEDVRQETFARFFLALRDGKILQPERLGAYVNSICNNVLLEHYRSSARSTSLDDEDGERFPATGVDLLGAISAKEREKKVREILEELSERDRRLLREVFLEERDKDEVCREFGVDREYLRVLLHRAKQAFKSSYLKHAGKHPPDFAPA